AHNLRYAAKGIGKDQTESESEKVIRVMTALATTSLLQIS
ncbi:hypothetical protein Trydic_g17342, partial [Trypoxylus dichotomus]